MFLMGIKKFTSPETCILYGTYTIYRPVCYRADISLKIRQACHMLHTVLIYPGDMMNNNQEFPLDGRKKYMIELIMSCITFSMPHMLYKE